MSMYRVGNHTIVPELPEKSGYQVMVRRVTTNTDGLTEDFVWLAVLPEPAYFVAATSDAYVTLLATIYAAENGMWYRCDMLAASKRWASCTLAGTLEGEYGEIATITKDSFSPDSDDIRVCANYDLRMANTVDGRLEPYGDVLVAASTPILVPEIANPGGIRDINAAKKLLMGLLIGQQLARQRDVGEPVACLYNGVRLPPLPDDDNWDKDTFKSAMISIVHTETGEIEYYHLACTQDGYPNLGDATSESTNPYVTYANLLKGVSALQAKLYPGEMVWSELKEAKIPGTAKLANVLWSSSDLYFADGALAFGASEPIPIY